MCERRNLRHTALYLVPFTAARLGNHAAVGDLAIVLSTRQFKQTRGRNCSDWMRYWLFAYCCQVAWASAGTETIEGNSSTGPQVLTAGAFVFFLVLGTVLLLQSGSLQEAERGLGLRAAGGRRSRSQSRVTFGGDCPIHCKHHREGRSLLDGCSGLQRDGKELVSLPTAAGILDRSSF